MCTVTVPASVTWHLDVLPWFIGPVLHSWSRPDDDGVGVDQVAHVNLRLEARQRT